MWNDCWVFFFFFSFFSRAWKRTQTQGTYTHTNIIASLIYSLLHSLKRFSVCMVSFCSSNSRKTYTLHKNIIIILLLLLTTKKREAKQANRNKKKTLLISPFASLPHFIPVHFIFGPFIVVIVIQCAEIGLCYGHTQSVIWFSSTRSTFCVCLGGPVCECDFFPHPSSSSSSSFSLVSLVHINGKGGDMLLLLFFRLGCFFLSAARFSFVLRISLAF